MAAYSSRRRIMLLDSMDNVVLRIRKGPLTQSVMPTLMAQELDEMAEYAGLAFHYMVAPRKS